jgi:hypothetical protein
MWKRIPDPSKDDEAVLRMSKRMKLYADEDIEDDVVEFFRRQDVNIKSARELGHRGKPDSFHASLAFREKRFLVTRNGKHYWDDRAVPMNRTHVPRRSSRADKACSSSERTQGLATERGESSITSLSVLRIASPIAWSRSSPGVRCHSFNQILKPASPRDRATRLASKESSNA